jgi:hypothetical protein
MASTSNREPEPLSGFYKFSDFLDVFAMSRTGAYRAVNEGKLRLTKNGRSTRISKADAKAWADSLPTIGGSV